jgi:uncharacterized protein
MTEPGYPGAATPDAGARRAAETGAPPTADESVPDVGRAAGVSAPQAPPSVPGQYLPPGAQTPPSSMPPPPSDFRAAQDQNWIFISHFGGAIGNLFCGMLGFVAPLVAFLNRGNQSPTVRQHAVAALNFQLLVSGVSIALVIIRVPLNASATAQTLSTLLWLANVGVMLAGAVFGVIAGLKANEGEPYRYPVSLSIIK